MFTTPAALAPAGPEAAPAPTAPAASPEAKVVNVDRQVLDEVVNKALARQLAPITEMLTEMTIHKTTLPDILGGIGYILGIFGLWAYFLSKRKKIS
jgi:nickel transport protein